MNQKGATNSQFKSISYNQNNKYQKLSLKNKKLITGSMIAYKVIMNIHWKNIYGNSNAD